MSRPQGRRTVSTNLSSGSGLRSLEGKLAIVTGSSRGIGAATARNLASKGCSIVLNYSSDSSTKKAEEVASQLEHDYSVRTLVVQADLGSTSGPEHLITVTKNNFSHPKTGQFRVDIIVNNAGTAWNQPVEEISLDAFETSYNVNVRGPLLLIKAALPFLPQDRSGRIVNVSSVSSSLGFSGQSVYGGTKAALEAMTRTWARELSERATVNSVNPGPVKTDMYGGTSEAFRNGVRPWLNHTPLSQAREDLDAPDEVASAKQWGGREARDEEIAGVIGMLCYPESAWTTGSNISANGGMIMTTT